MKRFVVLIALIACNAFAYAQNNLEFDIENYPSSEVYVVCLENEYSQAIIHSQNGCELFYWDVYQPNGSWNSYQNTNPLILDISSYSDEDFIEIVYHGCDIVVHLPLFFHESHVPEPATQMVWIRHGESTTLETQDCEECTYQWSTGASGTWRIEVAEPGTYTCVVSDELSCGEPSTITFIVQENVEITLATCDLESNHNMVTWSTTPAQAEYVSQVEIKRDGLLVGTAPYTDGQFIDNIGSDAASRTYTVTAIATDGTPCPITSYPKETIHMAYLTGINNTIEVNWNAPTGYDLLGYNICEWHENDGSLNVIDYVGASVTSYTCSQSQFDQGYIVVQGVEASKDGETRLFSNRSSETVGLGENGPSTGSGTLTVYPNPAKDRFIVEGSGTMTVTNTLGQTVLTQEIDGKASVELPQGMYFVKLGGATRKVVVE